MKDKFVDLKSYDILPEEMRSAVKESYQIHMMLLDKNKRNVWFHVSDSINPNNRFYIQLTIIPNIQQINEFVDNIPGFQSDKMIYEVRYDLKLNFIDSSDASYDFISYIFEDMLYEIRNGESKNIAIIPNLKTFFIIFDDEHTVSISRYILDITCFSPQYILKEGESDNYEAQVQYPEFGFSNTRLLRFPYDEYLCIGFEYSDGWYIFPDRRFDKVFSLSTKKEFDVFENECLIHYLTFRATAEIESRIPLYDIHDTVHATQALESLNEAMKNDNTMRYIDGLIQDSIKKSNESLLWEEKGPIKPSIIKIYKTLNPLWLIPVSI